MSWSRPRNVCSSATLTESSIVFSMRLYAPSVATVIDVEDSDEDLPPPPWEKQLIDYCIDLYFGTVLKAPHLCKIMYFLKQMGYPEAAPYAVKPERAHSGKFQEKLTKAFGFDKKLEDQLYPIQVPIRDAYTAEREIQTIWAQPAHEALHREFSENPDILHRWQDKIQEHGAWIPLYEKHPAVQGKTQEERKDITGVCLYMDGAEYTLKDGLIVFTIRFCSSGKRHLVWAIRKNQLCDCGCGGWCTLFPLFAFVAWSLLALQEGRFPTKRHDQTPFDDEQRQTLASNALGFVGLLFDILGDWKEFANSWGFPNWQAYFPCFLCAVPKMLQLNPHIEVRPRKNEEYEEHCAECEIFINVPSAQVQLEIRFKLQSDSTRKGFCLQADVSTVRPRLLKNDRLEPTMDFPDVCAIDLTKEPFKPFVLKFWRAKAPRGTIVHHRNPILSSVLGVGYDNFAVDVLHCKHLGVYLAWITRCLHLLFGLDAFETRSTRAGDHMRGNALALKSKVHVWYPVYEKSLSRTARKAVTRVNHITEKMLGSEDGKKLVKFKAAEARHFMPFTLALIREHSDLLRTVCDFDSLEKAGVCLQQWMLIVQREPRNMSRDAIRSLVHLQKEHNIAAEASGVHMRPKHHQATLLFCSETLKGWCQNEN